jgi:hypothetical protein
MKPIVVYVPENKVSFFMELIDSLNYKTIVDVDSFELSDAHKEILDQRLENYENHPESYLSWDEVSQEIEKML